MRLCHLCGKLSSSVLTEHRSFDGSNWSRLPFSCQLYHWLRPVILRAVSVEGVSHIWMWLRILALCFPSCLCPWWSNKGTLFQANSFESNVCLFNSGALLIGASSYYMHPLGASWQPDRVPFFLIQRTYILGFGLVHNPKESQAASALREGIKTEESAGFSSLSLSEPCYLGGLNMPKPGFILFSLVQDLGFWSASGPWSPRRASLASASLPILGRLSLHPVTLLDFLNHSWVLLGWVLIASSNRPVNMKIPVGNISGGRGKTGPPTHEWEVCLPWNGGRWRCNPIRVWFSVVSLGGRGNALLGLAHWFLSSFVILFSKYNHSYAFC